MGWGSFGRGSVVACVCGCVRCIACDHAARSRGLLAVTQEQQHVCAVSDHQRAIITSFGSVISPMVCSLFSSLIVSQHSTDNLPLASLIIYMRIQLSHLPFLRPLSSLILSPSLLLLSLAPPLLPCPSSSASYMKRNRRKQLKKTPFNPFFTSTLPSPPPLNLGEARMCRHTDYTHAYA